VISGEKGEVVFEQHNVDTPYYTGMQVAQVVKEEQ